MNNTPPRLLTYDTPECLSDTLLQDLQLSKLYNAQTLLVLQHPCKAVQIQRRQELFAHLEDNRSLAKFSVCLSALEAVARAYDLWLHTSIPLETYHRYANLLTAYLEACDCLIALEDLGQTCAEVSAYLRSEEQQRTREILQEDMQRIAGLLQATHAGLLSFSNKIWLTPPEPATVSEFQKISTCAQEMGLVPQERKRHDTKINASFSDALCRLYATEVAEIEALQTHLSKEAVTQVLAYIPEMIFFLDVHEMEQRASAKGIPHCLPEIASSPTYTAKALYDISLLIKQCEHIVPNDLACTEEELFFFLLGANGGGKTTFLRAVGINALLCLAGCPVFAKQACIYPFDIITAHFPKDERFDNTGRLNEEWTRTNQMLAQAIHKKALCLFNETYTGADDQRGFDLLQRTVDRVHEDGHFSLYVTHFHQVMQLNSPVLTAEVAEDDQHRRTYRITKSKGTACSYAADILRKYRLDKDSLKERAENA